MIQMEYPSIPLPLPPKIGQGRGEDLSYNLNKSRVVSPHPQTLPETGRGEREIESFLPRFAAKNSQTLMISPPSRFGLRQGLHQGVWPRWKDWGDRYLIIIVTEGPPKKGLI